MDRAGVSTCAHGAWTGDGELFPNVACCKETRKLSGESRASIILTISAPRQARRPDRFALAWAYPEQVAPGKGLGRPRPRGSTHNEAVRKQTPPLQQNLRRGQWTGLAFPPARTGLGQGMVGRDEFPVLANPRGIRAGNLRGRKILTWMASSKDRTVQRN